MLESQSHSVTVIFYVKNVFVKQFSSILNLERNHRTRFSEELLNLASNMSTSSENLWSTLLRECSKRSRFADAHCIFVGESMCGKSALVDKICHEDQNLIALHSPNEFVGYDYFDVEEGLSDSDLASKINVWSLNENFFENPLETFIQPSKNEKVIPLSILKSFEADEHYLGYFLVGDRLV